MLSIHRLVRLLSASAILLCAWSAHAQSFRVQCPTSTPSHPNGTASDGSHIKCQQISGGDGFATMGDGAPVYLFGFGPLSGLGDINNGLPGTEAPAVFNQTLKDFDAANGTNLYDSFLSGSGPSSLIGAPYDGFKFNGAIGLAVDPTSEQVASVAPALDGVGVPLAGTGYHVGDPVALTGGGFTTQATAQVGAVSGTGAITSITVTNPGNGYTATPFATVIRTSGTGTNAQIAVTMQQSNEVTGHVDPRMVMDVGVMNASQPAPLIAIDEDDELFLTLTNVGQIMRPDLFEQHTVHFHGYPNASSFYDGVPDASVAINIGGSFTYYYLAPDAGTYFWHCHISPPEHLQMGMVGQLYVRPRQNRVAVGGSAVRRAPARPERSAQGLQVRQRHPLRRRRCRRATPSRAGPTSCTPTTTATGPLRYDVEYPIQMHGVRPELPLRRHDLQPGVVHRHEGQVLPAQRPQLPGHRHAGRRCRRSRPTAPRTPRSRCRP